MSFLESSVKAEKIGEFSYLTICLWQNTEKKGKEGGKKGANRTGKSNPDHRNNGTDVTSDSHRRSTQKNGGKKTGVNPSSKSR